MRGAVASAVHDALTAAGQEFAAAALTRLGDGSTAMVLSVGNAGRAHVRGIEADATLRLSPNLQVNGNFSLFGFSLAASTFVPGDVVLPNTPARRGNISVTYRERKLDLSASLHLTTAFDWSAGTFQGRVPATQTVNASSGYAFGRGLRVQLLATNLLGQRRYQNFGGAVIGRRVLAGISAKF
jgi:outer membrane receptor protein involved in Fe transport